DDGSLGPWKVFVMIVIPLEVHGSTPFVDPSSFILAHSGHIFLGHRWGREKKPGATCEGGRGD
ncbi:MAG: hypothetical protein FWD75_09360, partial [Propionibacteriaceae bacterium]|nr:hypothetical protein [Propionibacteriaceae bacterium]